MSSSTSISANESCFQHWPKPTNNDNSQFIIIPISSCFDLRGTFDELHPSTGIPEAILIEETLAYFHALGVRVPNPSEVRDYLYRYPEMADLSRYVSELTHRYIDSRAQLSLEMYCDREIMDCYLTLYVRQHKYDKDIMKTIKKIRREYQDLFRETRGRLLLTTDFRSPG